MRRVEHSDRHSNTDSNSDICADGVADINRDPCDSDSCSNPDRTYGHSNGCSNSNTNPSADGDTDSNSSTYSKTEAEVAGVSFERPYLRRELKHLLVGCW